MFSFPHSKEENILHSLRRHLLKKKAVKQRPRCFGTLKNNTIHAGAVSFPRQSNPREQLSPKLAPELMGKVWRTAEPLHLSQGRPSPPQVREMALQRHGCMQPRANCCRSPLPKHSNTTLYYQKQTNQMSPDHSPPNVCHGEAAHEGGTKQGG